MRRLYRIKVVFTILTFLLILYTFIQQNGISSKKKLPRIMQVHIYSSKFNSEQKPPLQLFLHSVKDFVVFLIEPKVLLSIVKEEYDITSKVYTFGMRADKVHTLNLSVLDELKNHGFNVFPVDSKENDLSHVILYHQSSLLLVHLIMFHEKWKGFIKSESLLVSSFPSWLPHTRLNFGESAYGYNRLELAKVHLNNDNLTLYMPANVGRFVDEEIPESTFIECDNRRVNLFYDSYPDYKVYYRNFHYKASILLHDLKQAMDDAGIKFWLEGGTLLGWYRQCDLIHNTRDMDIEIYAKHYKPTMKKSLGSHDLYLIRELGKLQDSFEMTFKKYSIRLDVFCLYEGKDDNWTGAVGGNGTKYRFMIPKIQLCWGELLGVPVRVPCNTFEFVKKVYGDDWNKTAENWIWDESPKNLIVVGEYSGEEMDKYNVSMESYIDIIKDWFRSIFIEIYYFFFFLNLTP